MNCRLSGPGRNVPVFLLICLLSFVGAAAADTLRGRVVDPDSRPVAGAEVLVLRGQSVIASVRTGSDGRFGPLTLPTETYTLVVATRGFRLPETTVRLSPTAPQELTLTLAVAAIGDSVVVSAAQVDTTLSRSGDSITVIDRETIDRQQMVGVADALRLVPGFGVTASGGTGALTSLLPRGGESDYTMVLVDGVVQNSVGGGMDMAHLDLADVDRIEVVRGPQSALYGSGAIGGLVHVVTRHGGAWWSTAQAEAGGYGTRSGTASVAGSRHAFTFGGGATWLDAAGDTRTRPGIGVISNDDYTRTSAAGSLGWSDRATRRLRVDARTGRNERGFPGPYGSDPEGLYSGLDLVSRGVNRTHDVGGSAFAAQGGSMFHRVQVNWFQTTGTFTSPFGTSEDGSRRVTGRYQWDREGGRLGLSAGGERLAERASNTYITGETFQPVPVERSSTGLFAEVRPVLGHGVFVTAGLRLERLDRRALEANPGNRPAFESQTIWSANPKLSVSWFARQTGDGRARIGWTRLRLGAGTGIKAPTAFEIAYTDNPDLQPERSRSLDIGLEQALAGGRVVVDATWFRNTYDDLIVSVGRTLSGASRYRTDNIANARTRGLELGGTWKAVSALSIRGSWTYLTTEVLAVDSLRIAPSPYEVGSPLARRPRLAGALDVMWSRNRVSAFGTVSGRGDMTDLEPNYASSLADAPGFTTTAIGASVRLAHGVEAYGRLTNAFKVAYEEVLGYPARGRAAFVGIRVAQGH